MKKLLALFVVVLGFSAVSFAQLTNTASSSATATIFTALTVEKKADLAFGKLGAKTSPTLAVMSTTDSRASSTSDVIADVTAKAAEFEVRGDALSNFSVTTPASSTSLDLSGQPSMTIDATDWTVKIDAAADSKSGSIAGTGVTKVKVGATLKVGALQPSGNYVGTFNVTVNYN